MMISAMQQEEPEEPRVLELRNRLEAELTCSAQSMDELTPWKNTPLGLNYLTRTRNRSIAKADRFRSI